MVVYRFNGGDTLPMVGSNPFVTQLFGFIFFCFLVLQSGASLFANYNVENIIVEFVPHRLGLNAALILNWAWENNFFIYVPPPDWPPRFAFKFEPKDLRLIDKTDTMESILNVLREANVEHNLLFTKHHVTILDDSL